MSTPTPYSTYVNEVLGQAYTAMGMKPITRLPRKKKKAQKKWNEKAIATSWGRRGIIQWNAEIKTMREYFFPNIENNILEWAKEHNLTPNSPNQTASL